MYHYVLLTNSFQEPRLPVSTKVGRIKHRNGDTYICSHKSTSQKKGPVGKIGQFGIHAY